MSLTVDVFYRGSSNYAKKPIRHIFHLNKLRKIKSLSQKIGKLYSENYECIVFYNEEGKEYKQEMLLKKITNTNEKIFCYILKDWNTEISVNQILGNKIAFFIAKCSHSRLLFYPGHRNKRQQFGLSFAVSFLNTHSNRDFHKIIYERLSLWIGSKFLPLPNTKYLDYSLISGYLNECDYNIPKGIKNIITSYFPFNLKIGIRSENDLDFHFLNYENEWNKVFERLPYNLYLTNSNIVIPIDYQNFKKFCTKNGSFNICVEWSSSPFSRFDKHIQSSLTNIDYDTEYLEWRHNQQQQIIQGSSDDIEVTINECLDDYFLKCNDFCPNCDKKKSMQYLINSLPEILIIHIDRFKIGYSKQKIKNMVYFPKKGLDLTKYCHLQQNNVKYDLYAVVNHDYNYSSFILDSTNTNNWYCIKDRDVHYCQNSEVVSKDAYILFYRKRKSYIQ